VESSEFRSEQGIGLPKPENLLFCSLAKKQILHRFAPQNEGLVGFERSAVGFEKLRSTKRRVLQCKEAPEA
jgi:hypothetical protein